MHSTLGSPSYPAEHSHSYPPYSFFCSQRPHHRIHQCLVTCLLSMEHTIILTVAFYFGVSLIPSWAITLVSALLICAVSIIYTCRIVTRIAFINIWQHDIKTLLQSMCRKRGVGNDFAKQQQQETMDASCNCLWEDILSPGIFKFSWGATPSSWGAIFQGTYD